MSEPVNEPRASRMRSFRKACFICHSRKVKCDAALKGFPCSNCRAAGINCTVSERRKRRRLTSGREQEAHGASEDAFQPQIQPQSRSLQHSRDTSASPSVPDTTGANGQAGSPNQPNAAEQELAKQHLVDFFSQDLQHSPIKQRLTYIGNELSNVHYMTRQRPHDDRVYHFPCANSYVPRVMKESHSIENPILIPKDAFVLPPKHISDLLVEAYFEVVHPTFPILNKEGFLEQYHDQHSSPPLLLLQSVCLAGSHVATAFKNKQDLKAAFFRRAKALLYGRYEGDRMEMVQAALLLAWFSDGGDDVCANAWWWIGIASRTAIGLGMHREVGPSKMPEMDKRTWRRIWWCLVQFDCLVSLCYGRPLNINMDDTDVSPLRRDDFDDSVSESDANFVIHQSKLCSSVSDLVRVHFSVRAVSSIARRQKALEAVDAELAEWFLGLPAELRDPERQKGKAGGEGINAQLLHLSYNGILIQCHRLLARPLGGGVDVNVRAHEDICIEAATNIIQILERLIQQSALQRCWFMVPSFLFAAMLQSRSQVKNSNPILAIKARGRYDSGLRSLRKLSRHWLYSASVWRLFQSNSIATSNSTADGVQIGIELDSPNQASSVAAASSTRLDQDPQNETILPDTQNEFQAQPQDMNWIHLSGQGELGLNNMYVERNRWHDNMEQWQSLYWSDPLADMSLPDDLGGFQVQWSM